MSFIARRQVRFEDVDFAQVVFYPRFYVYCHHAFEDFFQTEVNIPYARMLSEHRVGFPTVHCEGDFRRPLRFGDAFRIELDTLQISRRSIHSRYRFFLGESAELCADLKVVTAAVDLNAFGSVDLPSEVRAAFERHLAFRDGVLRGQT